jgi:hypothetical protein
MQGGPSVSRAANERTVTADAFGAGCVLVAVLLVRGCGDRDRGGAAGVRAAARLSASSPLQAFVDRGVREFPEQAATGERDKAR